MKRKHRKRVRRDHRRAHSLAQTAIHEAGHAVAAYRLGLDFEYATIERTATSDGHVRVFMPRSVASDKLINAAAMSLAGPLAEIRSVLEEGQQGERVALMRKIGGGDLRDALRASPPLEGGNGISLGFSRSETMLVLPSNTSKKFNDFNNRFLMIITLIVTRFFG